MWKKPNHPRAEWVLCYRSLAVSLVGYFAIFFSIDFFSERPEGIPPYSFFKMLYYGVINVALVAIGPFLASAILAYFRPALAAGASLGMLLFCGVFSVWNTDSLGWLIYLFSLPAGFVACLVLGFCARSLPMPKAFLLSLGAVPAAMYANFLIVYNYI